MKYEPQYTRQFKADLDRYASKKKQVENKIKLILANPYFNTEQLHNKDGFNLEGIRSKRIDRNFRILFAICEECKQRFSSPKDARPCKKCHSTLPVESIIFYAIGPHEPIYEKNKPLSNEIDQDD